MIALGTLIGPVLALLLVLQTSHILYSLPLLLPIAVLQIRGLVLTLRAWRGRSALEGTTVDDDAASFVTTPQRGSVVLAVLGVVFVSLTWGGYLAVASSFNGGWNGLLAALMLITGLTGAGAVIVPMLLFQSAWRCRPSVLASEQVVLAGAHQGGAARVRRGRLVALIGWLVLLAAVLSLIATTLLGVSF